MTSSILVFNAGSSSLKYSLFDRETLDPLYTGEIEDITASFNKVLPGVLELIESKTGTRPLAAVGHRIVHGGKVYRSPTLITPEVMENLRTFIPLAPLHQPYNLEIIKLTQEVYKKIPHVACFDTSFHRTQSTLVEMFPLPRKFTKEGIIRYGFHGLSYDYIASQLPTYAPEKAHKRVIVAHLGSGASLCALKNLKSVATSMGFTALDGLMMGTRPGSIDPGILLYLLEEKGVSLKEVTDILYNQSGLFGVSGLTNDMRVLLKSKDPNAREAIDLFCYTAAKHIGSLLPPLGGLDVLVFTAGIGEHCPEIRTKICHYLKWLGTDLEDTLNESNACKISTPQSQIDIYVIPTQEDLMIAQYTQKYCLK
jgi:acetate kinase